MIPDSMDISLFIDSATLLCAVVASVFALLEFRRTNRLKAASHLKEVIVRLRSDREASRFIQAVDYGEFKYDRSFANSELERQVDSTLESLSYLCYLRKKGIIGEDEFGFAEYEITRLLMDKEVQKYLFNFYHFSNKALAKKESAEESVSGPFQYLLAYAKEKGFIDKEFFDKDNNKYEKILPF